MVAPTGTSDGSPLATYISVTPERTYARSSPLPFEGVIEVVMRVWVKVGEPDIAFVER
jgi:hypothetical protein